MDLRSYIDKVQGLWPEQVKYVEKPVSSEHELSAVTKKGERLAGKPFFYFKNVDDQSIPVVCGLFSTRERLALALDLDSETFRPEFVKRITKTIEPTLVDDALCHDSFYSGDEVDLSKLPNPVHSPEDGGRYITAGVCLAKDPVSGATNAGIYRIMVKSNNELTILAAPEHDMGKLIADAQKNDRELEVAIVIGAHPSFFLASQAKVPLSTDSLGLMGSLVNESIEVAQCKTVDLKVPAHSEIVIEGKIKPDNHSSEGPFGEFSFFYGAEDSVPVIDVTAITHRADPIYLDIHPAHDDHRSLWLYPGREVRIFDFVKKSVPAVLDVHIPVSGSGLLAFIKIKKNNDGEARRALMLALSADIYIKQAFIFDEDVDIYNNDNILWALGVRFQGDRDMFAIPNVEGFAEDPSSYSMFDASVQGGLTTKTGFDVTVPMSSTEAPRADLLPEKYVDLDLSDYIDI